MQMPLGGNDALLDGHSHSVMEAELVKNKDGKDVLMAACGTKLANVGALTITPDGKLSSELFTWKNSVAPTEIFGLTGPVVDAVAADIRIADSGASSRRDASP